MTTGVYVCGCGGILSDLIDGDEIASRFAAAGLSGYVKLVELACSSDGTEWIARDLGAEKPDRVVIAACSPRDHEGTFRAAVAAGGLNPFLMQMVNIREHVAWVTPDKASATEKAWHQIRGAIARVALQTPLERELIDVSTDVLVIGGGPAGLKAALTLAEAGRKVVLVEKDPILGGMPLRYEEIFPGMECGPCLIEPFLADVLHGPHAHNIERLLMAEVTEMRGSFGNFEVTIRRRPRHASLELCIGCGECIGACPVTYPNPFNSGSGERHAMDFVYFGGLPSAPYLDEAKCTRHVSGDGCTACRDACPVEGAIDYDEGETTEVRQIGAVVLAVGAGLYDVGRLANLGYGTVPDVVTSLECERMFSSNGPTEGVPQKANGVVPQRIALVHCAGSLDESHRDYCSGICCLDAFKLNLNAEHKIDGSTVTHYFRTLTVPGKEEAEMFRKATRREGVEMLRYECADDLRVETGSHGGPTIALRGETRAHDLVVLMPPVVPSASVGTLARVLDIPTDRQGFFEEMNARVDSTSSKVRGVHLAGTCQGPMDLGRAMSQGLAAAGSVLAELVPGRQLELEAVYAVVDEDRCSACRSCIGVCPYRAITFDAVKEVAGVNPALCVGCGTCVAACPANALGGRHFTTEQIFAEIEGVLQ